MNTFCTIVTSDYIHYALALYESLCNHMQDAKLQVLVVDRESNYNAEELPNGITLYEVEQIDTPLAKRVKEKYYHELRGVYRWSMKSVFVSYLLSSFEKVIFLDPDIYFFENAEFLFELLDDNNVILSPHWRLPDARVKKNDMIRIYDHGIHNAGFVASQKSGKSAMDWWAEACIFSCEKNEKNAQWDDQTYLSAMHLFFEKIYILKHLGCNVAHWNYRYCRRMVYKNKVLIGGRYPIVFIHFDPDTLKHIRNDKEDYLHPYLERYEMNVSMAKRIYKTV